MGYARLLGLSMSLGLMVPVVGQEPRPQDQEKVKVAFSGIELEALARQVERVTKKTFIHQEATLRGKKVTLQSETAITPDELYRVFQSVCLMNGLALVPARDGALDLVKIVPVTQAAKEPGVQPILTRGDPLPPGDSLVFYVFTPKHLASARAVALLGPVTSPSGSVQQVPNSDLVFLTDVASTVQRVEKLLALLDVPGEPVLAETVTPKNLPAGQAKSQITEYLQAHDKASGREAARSRITILADDRLNLVHLIGPEAEVKKAGGFLKEIDREQPSVKRTIAYYRLKNVPVGDIADSVRQFLGLAASLRQPDRRLGAQSRSPVAGAPARDLGGQPVIPPGVVPPAQPAPFKPESGQLPLPASAAGQGASAPAASDIEIVPLAGLNTLAVIGNQAVHEEVKKILENLDKRKGQVLIEVAVIQVTGDDSVETGVEVLFADRKGDGAILAGGTGFAQGSQASTAGTGFPNVQNLASFQGGALRYLKPEDISVLIRMISTKAHVNILSQPLLLVNDNEEANFTTKVSEPTTITSQGTTTTLTSFAGFAEAVTSLTITPQISPDGYLNIRITQTFEEFSGGSPSSGVPPPKVSNEVTTLITVPDRHTAIMGGFTRDALTDTRSGVPILMDLPLLGMLFSQQSQRLTKSRLYLFVRPRILSTDGFADLKDVSREKAADVRSFTTDPRIRGQVRDSVGSGDKGIRMAPLPFGEEKK